MIVQDGSIKDPTSLKSVHESLLGPGFQTEDLDHSHATLVLFAYSQGQVDQLFFVVHVHPRGTGSNADLENYSYRNATIGSTWVARRAGI
jgi:hypothetical protein